MLNYNSYFSFTKELIFKYKTNTNIDHCLVMQTKDWALFFIKPCEPWSFCVLEAKQIFATKPQSHKVTPILV